MELTIRPSILDRPRTLAIEPDFISYEDNAAGGPVKFLKTEIGALRYGVKWIQGAYFLIGRTYCIDIQDMEQRVIKLRMKSLYGVRKQQLGEKYLAIINLLFEYYFEDMVKDYSARLAGGNSFDIAGASFNADGVQTHAGFFAWPDLGVKEYSTYHVLHSKQEPTRYASFAYMNDWNAAVLYGVSRHILKWKGLL